MKFKTIITGTFFLMGANVHAQQLTLKTDNIDQIIEALTLEEKAHLLVGRENSKSNTGVPGAAGTTQGVERLGIPGIVLTDGPAGVRISPRRKGDTQTYYATGFPVGTALACTFSEDPVVSGIQSMDGDVLLQPAEWYMDAIQSGIADYDSAGGMGL